MTTQKVQCGPVEESRRLQITFRVRNLSQIALKSRGISQQLSCFQVAILNQKPPSMRQSRVALTKMGTKWMHCILQRNIWRKLQTMRPVRASLTNGWRVKRREMICGNWMKMEHNWSNTRRVKLLQRANLRDPLKKRHQVNTIWRLASTMLAWASRLPSSTSLQSRATMHSILESRCLMELKRLELSKLVINFWSQMQTKTSRSWF